MRKIYTLALVLALIPFAGGFFAFFQSSPTTYYISNSGSDSLDGHSPATAWKTIAKINTVAAASGFHAGDQILLKRGDVWHEMMFLGSRYNSTSTSTLTANPPTFTGAAGNPIVIDAYGVGRKPVIDSADAVIGETTLYDADSGTYTIPMPSAGMPGKLFYNCTFSDCPQLLPVPNYSGECSLTVTYNPLDLVTCGTYTVYSPLQNATLTQPNVNIHGMGSNSVGVPTSNGTVWVANLNNSHFYDCSPDCAYGQYFNITNSGPQNVIANPGSWYPDSDAGLIYIHLADGSDPGDGQLSGTYRKYGVEMLSTNYVTVRNLIVEHSQKSCILAMAYSSNQGGNYRTNENITITQNDLWNCGDSTQDSEPNQAGGNVLNGALTVRADGSTAPVLLNGISITRNDIGTVDTYFGIRGVSLTGGIEAVGLNAAIISNNRIHVHNTRGLVSNTVGLANSGTLLEPGVQISYNELTDNQGNIFAGFKAGVAIFGNYIHDYYGEGIQWGGGSIGSASAPLIAHHNLIVHGYISADASLYNGSDCNGNATNVQLRHMTIYDPWGADFSMEVGCTGGTIVDSIFVNQASRFPGYSSNNSSFLFYYTAASRDSNTVLGHNYYVNGTSPNPFHTTSVSYNTSTYASGWPDSTSIITNTVPFRSAGPGIYGRDYRLVLGSSAVGTASDGYNIGAFDGSPDSFDLAKVGPRAGQQLNSFSGKKY